MTSTVTTAQVSSPVRTEIATLWRLSWPMLVGQLATVGMGVADVAMTGHVSAAELVFTNDFCGLDRFSHAYNLVRGERAGE